MMRTTRWRDTRVGHERYLNGHYLEVYYHGGWYRVIDGIKSPEILGSQRAAKVACTRDARSKQ